MYQWNELAKELEELKEKGLYTNIRTLEGPQGAWLQINGEDVLNLSSNNYLGLADDEDLVKSSIEATAEWGVGPGAVRTIAGTMTLHNQLEEDLAKFKGVEATIMVQSGFCANQAVVPAIMGADDAILSDELNHASIIDAVRLTKSKRYVWKHKDVSDLRVKLEEAKADGAVKMLVITDGVFSMDGDLAPLPGIVEACEEFGAILMVDDAHGEGVLGDHGRGIVDHFGLHGRVDIEVGTLSKAFGVIGGFIAGKKVLIDYLKQKARPFLFSSSLSPADTMAAIESVRKLSESDELVKKLWENGNYFKKHMKELGFDIGESETPITPVMLYEAPVASEFSRRLLEKGVFAQSIGFPTVPRGKARIRVMISASHSKDDLDAGIRAFEEVGKELKII
ncbi:MAG TPA: glycine C-acetyltransferase [Thermotogota bacterium]|nr:glycine C-acetyltransferase [Thermotogota bacterium]HPJ87618.1 glycine C-acetyltransferase [Thermotogota bacterium]HPR94944.1 glycine C-acetyltransferase [Thermotogota bacterium]